MVVKTTDVCRKLVEQFSLENKYDIPGYFSLEKVNEAFLLITHNVDVFKL